MTKTQFSICLYLDVGDSPARRGRRVPWITYLPSSMEDKSKEDRKENGMKLRQHLVALISESQVSFPLLIPRTLDFTAFFFSLYDSLSLEWLAGAQVTHISGYTTGENDSFAQQPCPDSSPSGRSE